MEWNTKNIIIVVAVAFIVIVGGYSLLGSGGDAETEAPATESG